MFGGSTRLYEVVWEVKTDESYSSLAAPMSFVFGKVEFKLDLGVRDVVADIS